MPQVQKDMRAYHVPFGGALFLYLQWYVWFWHRFKHLHAGDKENTGGIVPSPEDKEQFVYLNRQLSQLTDNLRSLVSDENQEQR
jgi:hypothetical protein